MDVSNVFFTRAPQRSLPISLRVGKQPIEVPIMQSSDGVQPLHLFRAFIAFVADHLADEKAVFLLRVSIVVFAIKAAARKLMLFEAQKVFK